MPELKKIILVEDDPLDAEMTQTVLDQIPIANEIVWLQTGDELIKHLETKGGKDIAVVILDLKMPRMNGIEALRIIRENNYEYFPIVILTSSKESPDIKACYDLGVNSFVTKPVKTQEFGEAVRELGLYWAVINELPS